MTLLTPPSPVNNAKRVNKANLVNNINRVKNTTPATRLGRPASSIVHRDNLNQCPIRDS